MKKLLFLALTLASAGISPLLAELSPSDSHITSAVPKLVAPHAATKKVEICFVLDTTGSMSGLIDGAKKKIWSIANHIVQDQNAPEVKFSLIGYRDRGDAYITKLTALTDDLDAIQQELNTFDAGGGGDHPESVNQALYEAVQKIQWSDAKNTQKIIFLVGDAPPHMDYKQDVIYSTSCEGAKAKGIIINTLQCGQHTETTQIWAKIAMLGGGQFAGIPQNGGAQAVHCPQGARLAELGRQLNETVIPYGTLKKRNEVKAKCDDVKKLSTASQAARSSYNWSQKESKAITGNDDLNVEIVNNRVTIKTLKKEHLPEKLQSLSTADLQSHIAENLTKRSKIQTEIKKLTSKRNAYLKEQSTKAPKDAFDQKMKAMIDKQIRL